MDTFRDMPETITERFVALAGLLSAVVLVCVAFSTKPQRGVVPLAVRAAAQSSPHAPSGSVDTTAQTVSQLATPPEGSSTRTAVLVLTAARGDCWLSVYSGGFDGQVLYEGLLTSGRSVRVRSARLSVRFGAAANVDLSVNGRRVAALPSATASVVVTAAGVRATTA